jgi:DNA-binding transcriptional LysR family regulator
MSKIDSLRGAERLDTEILRTFLAVAESGSITGGAERILRSQSAVSLQIKRLEMLLGRAVFIRHGRGVTLATAGEKLRPMAQRLLTQLDDALADLKSDSMEGRLRVGIPDEYRQIILPQVIATFSREHPRVELSVQCALSANFPKTLLRGQLDIAIFNVREPEQGQQVLRRQHVAWFSSPIHLAHERAPVPVALFDRDCWWRDSAIESLRQVGKKYRVVYTSESVPGVVAAIEAGIAIGLLSKDPLRGELIELTGAEGFPKMPTSTLVLGRRDRADQALANAMSKAIRAAFTGLLNV